MTLIIRRGPSVAAASLPAAAALIWLASLLPAAAQGTLDARYNITLAGLSIGRAEWTAAIGEDRYSVWAKGGASGLFKVLVTGTGEARAEGVIRDGKLQPVTFASKVVADDETSELKIAFDRGAARVQRTTPQILHSDLVPLTETDRTGVIDTLSGMLIPIGGGSDVLNPGQFLSDEICQPRIPIFDGNRRFDLRLSFKRVDRVRAERGYEGAAVVCAMTFQPLAGYRTSSTLVSYLADSRDMELWMAPIAGTNFAAPFKISVANLIGNLVMQATQYETVSQARESAIITVAPEPKPKSRK